MAKTLANIQTEVRMYLDEATAADWLDSEVTLAINRAYHATIQRVIEVYDGWYNTTSPFTYAVVASQQEYTIDTSLIKVTRVEINYNPLVASSVLARALPVKMDEMRGNLANTSTSGSYFSVAYYLNGNIGSQKIGFVPIPTVSDTTGKSISVWGISLPSDLANTTDDVNIPYADNFSYLVALRAAAQLLRKGQQEEQFASRYVEEFEAGVIEYQTFLKDRQSDDGQYIEDSAMEQIDFSTTPIV